MLLSLSLPLPLSSRSFRLLCASLCLLLLHRPRILFLCTASTAVNTVDDPSRWQPDAYQETHKSIVSDGSSSSDDSDDEVLLEDWTTSKDEYDTTSDSAEPEKKGPDNFIPETEFCKFFHQFTLEHQRTLLNIMETKTYTDQQDIVSQGEDGDSFYVIKDGEAAVLKSDLEGKEKEITHLYKGQSFGEIALIYGGKRVASVRSVGRCTCLSLSKAVFEQQHDVRMFLVTKKVPMLADLGQLDRLNIVSKLQPRTFEKGAYVIREGDLVVDDAFYMITKGQAAVVEIQKDGKENILTRLFEGHCFGEMALVTDLPRTASIVATTDKLQCMCLTKQDFKGSVAGGDLSAIIKKHAEERKEIRLKRKQSGHGMLTDGRKHLMRQSSLVSTNGHFKTVRVCKKTGHDKKGTMMINQYRIGKVLGTGSYSTVRLGYDTTKMDKQVAIKIMDKHALGKKSVGQKTSPLDDVMREISAQKKLKHSGIVQLIECIDDPKQKDLYLVQEFCQGGEILVKQPLSPEKARNYLRDLLRGVEYMHYMNVIHRDIKPENILLTAEGRTKIADFGTAAIVTKGEDLTVPKGTPAFMAPELLSYDTIKYSGRPCDIWSLGATLYMLVVGQPPWMANNEIDLAKKVKDDEVVFPEPDSSNGDDNNKPSPQLNPHLVHLIKHMLEKDASKRPGLGDVMQHEWVTAEGSEPLPPLYGYGAPRFEEEKKKKEEEINAFSSSQFNLVEECGSSSSDSDSDESVTDGFDGPQYEKETKQQPELDPHALEPLEKNVPFPRDCTVADISAHKDHNIRMLCSLAENIGVRDNMEDKPVAHMNIPVNNGQSTLSYFATFDGHGGDGASSQLQVNLHSVLAKQPDLCTDIEAAVTRAWHIMDWRLLTSAASTLRKKRQAKSKSLMRTMRKKPNEDNHLSGATAAVVVVVNKAEAATAAAAAADTIAAAPLELVICWAGDSRVVLSADGGTAIELSEDHTASRPDEKKRVQLAGGSVDSSHRVGGVLAVSRAFGDIMHKSIMDGDEFLQLIGSISEQNAAQLQEGPLICTPDIRRHSIEPSDEFLIIASDGIWDVLTSQEAVFFVRRFLALNGGDVDAAANAIISHSLLLGSVDNVSAVIVVLNQL